MPISSEVSGISLLDLQRRLRNRTAPAHLTLQRLAPFSRSDTLAKAATALGRVVKTVYVLRYLHDEEPRERVQLQLTAGESRHQLARRLSSRTKGRFGWQTMKKS